MSNSKRRQTERRRALWAEVTQRLLSKARSTIGLEPDAIIPDAELLAEVERYLPLYPARGSEIDARLRPREQWFGYRLLGVGHTHSARLDLAAQLRDGVAGGRPLGFGQRSSRGRRSPAAGRRRNLRNRRAA